MISGGMFDTGPCNPRNVVLKATDLNNDGYLDFVYDGQCAESPHYKEDPWPTVPSIQLHTPSGKMAFPSRFFGTYTMEGKNDPDGKVGDLRKFALNLDWGWQAATASGQTLFSIGDEVLTSRASKGRIQSFYIYLDPSYNAVRWTAEVMTAKGRVSDEIDLNKLVLLSPISNLEGAVDSTFTYVCQQRQKELERLKEISSYTDYSCLKPAVKTEVDAIHAALAATLREAPDFLAQDPIGRTFVLDWVLAKLELTHIKYNIQNAVLYAKR